MFAGIFLGGGNGPILPPENVFLKWPFDLEYNTLCFTPAYIIALQSVYIIIIFFQAIGYTWLAALLGATSFPCLEHQI